VSPGWLGPPGRTVVAVAPDGTVIGSANMYANREGGGAHIASASFMVDPAHHGQGAGRALGQAGAPGRHPLRATVFGRELQVGVAEFNTPPVRLVTKEKASMPGKTRVRLRTDRTSIPFTFAHDG
jgi:GNAT superfamily N-acetyltransferase